MSTHRNDLFYTDIESEAWVHLNKYFISHEFPNSLKVIDAY